MDVYTFGVVLGTGGLGAMALSGLAHHGHGGHDNDASNVSLPGAARGAGPGHAPAPSNGSLAVAARGVVGGARGGAGLASSVARVVWSWLSPRVLFSALVGFGATGIVLRAFVHGGVLFALAFAGGVAFERLLARPLWDVALRFGSHPARTLEACVTDRAKAVTSFDASGHGLVAVELDGQVVQLLATLRREEVASGIRVKSGEELFIDDVDTARNRCTVSRLRH